MIKRLLPLALLILLGSGPAHAQSGKMMPGIYLSDVTQLCFPALNVVMKLNTAGFTLMESGMDKSGMSTRMMAVNRETEMVMSVFLEFSTEKGDAKAAREYYWTRMKDSPLKMSDIELSEIDGVPVVEHTVSVEGSKMTQKNYNAYWSRNSVWIDLHLSKMNATAEDDDAFIAVISSVSVGGR